MATPLLSAALIVKNEQATLPACLASLATLGPLLHEVCVYDTGSTDDTVAIARGSGARVTQGFWDDDFSRARNAAIEMCAGRWVLIIDADETVVASPEALRRKLRGTADNVDVLAVAHRNEATGKPMDMASIRFVRRSRVRYQHRVHEAAVRRDRRELTVAQLSADAFRMVHTGYVDHAKTQDKLRRNLDLADAQVRALQADGVTGGQEFLKALVDRARTASAVGDFDQAVADFELIRNGHGPTRYRTYGMEVYAIQLLERERWTEAARVLAELVDGGGSDPQMLAFLHARLAFGLGDAGSALELVRDVNVITDAAYMAHQTTHAIELRMLAAAKVGELEEALACCLQLILTHHKVAGYGPLLVGLWGARPVPALVELLSETPQDFTAAVVAELDCAPGWGPEAASALRARTLPAPATV